MSEENSKSSSETMPLYLQEKVQVLDERISNAKEAFQENSQQFNKAIVEDLKDGKIGGIPQEKLEELQINASQSFGNLHYLSELKEEQTRNFEVFSKLPVCPTSEQEIQEPNSGFTLDNRLIETFHEGANNVYRSTEPIKIIDSKGKTYHAGQQCAYNNEELMTTGKGAGTPDIVSPEQNKLDHFSKDVLPWFSRPLEDYHLTHPPHLGKENELSKTEMESLPETNNNKEGDLSESEKQNLLEPNNEQENSLVESSNETEANSNELEDLAEFELEPG